ncbi:F-box/FBD/LRR-repeat protein At1g13570-like [Bidens hawaiensis]|uniref:F-box/FBD/LRR-repeat protein At1g13570-like n=1 Tax=Bidens hawaiensis TaxID=980011 RepID=UPI0040495E4D
MPVRDAVRTCILSKKWRYSWRSMPKLAFTNQLVKVSSSSRRKQLNCKIANAIFHVLLLHDGPEILEFNSSVGHINVESEFVNIMSYLAKANRLKELIFCNDDRSYKLPVSFFLLLGLERIDLQNCTFETPLTYNAFTRLKSVTFRNVEASSKMLQRFLSKCPLLEYLYLGHHGRLEFDVAVGGDKFTLVDLLWCVPLIRSLVISSYYIKDLSAHGMPHKLPTSVVRLKNLTLVVHLMKHNEISSALCVISISPMLEKIKFMYREQSMHPIKGPVHLEIQQHAAMESMKMKLFAAVVVMLMAVTNVAALEAPAAAPGPASAAAGVFVPTVVASVVAISLGFLF